MAFTKRRKQPALFRGDNPRPTAEEKAAGVPARIAHSRPHPTAEERAVTVAQRTARGPDGSSQLLTPPKKKAAKKVRK